MGDNFILSSIKPIKNTDKKHKKKYENLSIRIQKNIFKKRTIVIQNFKNKKKTKVNKKIKPPNNGTGFV